MANASLWGQSFSPAEHGKLSPQNWCVTEGALGKIYLGNNNNIVEYTGGQWTEIKVKDDARVNALLQYQDRLYVGAGNDFGYLQQTSSGQFNYISLRSYLPEPSMEIGPINNIIAYNEHTVVFKNYYKLFEYNFEIDTVRVIPAKKYDIEHLFKAGDLLLAYDINTHKVLKISQDLSTFSLFFQLSDAYNINDIEYDGHYIYALADHDYVFKYDLKGNLIEEIAFPSTLKNVVFNDLLIQDELFYLASKSGLYICDPGLHVVEHIDQENGLRDNHITSLFLDSKENLWMTLNNGLSVFNTKQSIRSYTGNNGLKGLVENMTKAYGKLYVATHDGLFEKHNNTKGFLKIDKGPKIQSANFDVLTFKTPEEELLLSISNTAVHEINKQGVSKVLYEGYAYRLHQSTVDLNRLFVGLEDGLISLYRENNTWINEGYILKTDYTIFNIDQQGQLLLLGDDPKGVYTELYYKPQNGGLVITSTQMFTTKEGLPKGMIIPLDHYIGTQEGIYTKEEDGFAPLMALNTKFKHLDPYVHRLSKDPRGNLWAVVQWNDTIEGSQKECQEIGFFHHGLSGWQWVSGPFSLINKGKIDAIFHEDSNVTWLGGTEGLFRFDRRLMKTKHQGYFTSISRVFSVNDRTLLFGGNYLDQKGHSSLLQPSSFILTLPYSQNQLEFEFAAQEYEDQQVQYATYLEGLDQGYSDFKGETKVLYKQLPEGTYTFYLKAKNRYGIISDASPYTFHILPPWYRTWWAYVAYVILAIALVLSVLYLWTSNLRTQVKEKTKEVVAQKEIIEEKNQDMMHSIEYAEKIQQSILPSRQFLKEHFKESFVIFKPRDVVSGDFYWAAHRAEKVFFSLMDCTGHGVPGAFMSMIGNSQLNELVVENQAADPGRILTQMRSNIIKALSQDGTSPNRDGMDGVLCCFDKEKYTLQFSGANNSVMLLRSSKNALKEGPNLILKPHKLSTDSYTIYELKPQKMPIGFYPEKEEDFKTKTYQLEPGDILYLTSDGYPDQFGGPKGKKFMKAHFLKYLLSIQESSLEQQQYSLWQKMENWMGEAHEQVDDICVMAIKV